MALGTSAGNSTGRRSNHIRPTRVSLSGASGWSYTPYGGYPCASDANDLQYNDGQSGSHDPTPSLFGEAQVVAENAHGTVSDRAASAITLTIVCLPRSGPPGAHSEWPKTAVTNRSRKR